ncbi:CvpA family protein [[Bacillus] enclensis]|uniref:CvpA family protein n=1 Tax=[Bacillus] enclensis TaxID=1402860 RepID=UPI0018DBBBF7|nr:CvpA family protein [[Bacillus] enclensis]MBH9967033.1 CvpA family protein [[Bacillus] enclensis]
MLDLVLFIILLVGFLTGLRRGFILQAVHMTGFIIAFIVAYIYYDQLAPKLTLWIPYPSLDEQSKLQMIFEMTNMDQAYYRVIAFALIFFAVKIIVHIFGSMLDFVAHLPILKQLNVLGGGLLGLIETYLIIFILLFIAVLLPIDTVQSFINDSFIAQAMVKHTPVFSDMVKDWWLQNGA